MFCFNLKLNLSGLKFTTGKREIQTAGHGVVVAFFAQRTGGQSLNRNDRPRCYPWPVHGKGKFIRIMRIVGQFHAAESGRVYCDRADRLAGNHHTVSPLSTMQDGHFKAANTVLYFVLRSCGRRVRPCEQALQTAAVEQLPRLTNLR